MKRLTGFVFRHRGAVIVAFAAITAFFGFWIKDLALNSDVITYLPRQDEAVRLFTHLGEAFGQNDVVVAAVRSDAVFSASTLREVDELTRAFRQVEGVSSVVSLADMMDIRRASDGGIEIGRLFEPGHPPELPGQIQALQARVMGSERYRGSLVSADGRTTLVICQVRNSARAAEVVARLKAAARSAAPAGTVHFGGNSVLASELSSIMLADLKFLVPAVSVLIILTLFLAFGTVRGVLIPLVSVLMSAVWTLGLMALVKVPLTLLSNIIPALLMAIGTAPCIHILSKFDEDPRRYGSTGEEAQAAFREVAVRVILAALTIILGFSSFVGASYLTTIRDFGIFASAGVLFSLLISLFFVPALLASIHVAPRATPRLAPGDTRRVAGGTDGRLIERLMLNWAGILVRHRRTVIAAGVVVLAAAAIGVPFLRRESEFTSFLGEHNTERVTEALLQREFGGSRPLNVDFAGDLSNPAVLQEMLRFERFVGGTQLAHNPVSLADLVVQMNDLVDDQEVVPDDRAKVENLLFLLEGQEAVKGLVTDARDEGQIQCTVGLLDSRKLQATIRSLETYIASMDRELVSVPMAPLSATDRRRVMEYRTARSAQELEWIAARRADATLDHRGLQRALAREYVQAWPAASPAAAFSRLRPLLPASLVQDVAFQSESLGVLAGLGQLTAAVPLALYKSLDFSARQPVPEIIRFDVRFTGMPVISWHLDQSVLRSQVESLFLAVVFIFILLALKLRSWRGGLMGLAPIVLAVALMFGLMGLLGIPVNLATVLVGAIALGIGIDYSIHFSVRFSTYYRGPDTAAEAVTKTIQTTGLAIIINVLAVTMGFIALLFAGLIPLRQFGVLVAIAMIGSGAGALSLLPALMLSAPAAFMGRRWQKLRERPAGTSERHAKA